MLKLILIVLAAFSSASVLAAEPFPAFTSQYFSNGVVVGSFRNKLVAVEGKVTRIEAGPVGKPLVEIMLATPVSRTIWVGSLVKNDGALLEAGDIIRVLGYLQEVKSDDSWTKSVTSDRDQVLGFCILDITKKKALFLPAGINQCKDWEGGKSPSELM